MHKNTFFNIAYKSAEQLQLPSCTTSYIVCLTKGKAGVYSCYCVLYVYVHAMMQSMLAYSTQDQSTGDQTTAGSCERKCVIGLSSCRTRIMEG